MDRVKIHPILGGRAVDPVNRRFDCQQAKMVAEILRHGMKSDDREITADRKQDEAWAVTPEAWVELERARQNFRPQKRSRAVADSDDILGLALASELCKVFGKTVDSLGPLRPL